MTTVLIVEDDQANRELVAERLEACGYDVSAAGSGEEAMNAVRKGLRPDVLVLDVSLPKFDGFELLVKLRLQSPLRERLMPVIFMSGYADADHVVTGRSLGAVYLQKPFSMSSLQRAVADASHEAAMVAISQAQSSQSPTDDLDYNDFEDQNDFDDQNDYDITGV